MNFFKKIIKFFYRKLRKSNNKEIIKAVNLSNYETNKNDNYIYYDSYKKGTANFIFKNRDPITKKFFEKGEYDESIVIKSLKILKKEKIKILINLGGHVGTSIIPLIQKGYFSSGISFEPSVNNYKLLDANILINGLENKITTYNLAIGSKTSTGKMFTGEKDNTGDFRVFNEKRHLDDVNIFEKVSIVPLDNYWVSELKNECLILIDIQGHELEALEGASKFIENKIPIIMELSPYLLKEDSNLKMFLLLKNYEYIVDLRLGEIQKFNLENFDKIYSKYVNKNINLYTDILLY